jgi:sugar-specific transcriptional regulator TrmB
MEQTIGNVKFLLVNMGLNEYQASALSHLLYLGETKATTISKASGVPNARIYGVLDDLSKMGLVTTRPGRPVLYSPMTPNEVASALIADAREKIRRRLRIVESNSGDFTKLAEKIFLRGGKVESRVPLLRIVSVGDVSIDETKKLYRGAKKTIFILTRAMEYFPEVAEDLKEAITRGVVVRIIMMASDGLGEADRQKRDNIVDKIKSIVGKTAEIRVSDQVIIRGCIVDPEEEGKALFLVEEIGVPFFIREAAITAHLSVVKGLASMFDLMWRFDSHNQI